MADVFSEHVTKYGAFLYGGPNGKNHASASVWLRFANRPEFAWLRFYPPGYQLPENYETEHDAGHSDYNVSYRSGDYLKIIDLLRNESPVHFYWNSDTDVAYLRCGAEDVGEGEEDEYEE